MDDIYSYIDAHRDEYMALLQDLLHQPSVAAQGIGMAEILPILDRQLREIGMEPTRHDTRGGYPVVYAELPGASRKMLSFYNHYDVQPAEPLDQWLSDPWSGAIRDGRIYARGVADNKGNIAARIAAIDAYRTVRGDLPVSVKFIIEGEEEVGSPHLANFTADHPDLCAAEACIWEFGGTDVSGRPQIHLGLKGICYVELRCRGARLDWHSSVATSVPNPAWRLVWALSTIKDMDERVLIPGFYDDVVGATDEEREVLRNLPDTEGAFLENLGIEGFLKGLTGEALKEWDHFQPTCTISGFLSGYTGTGSKTVLPSTAMAKLDMRLVANQDPHDIYDKLRAHLDAEGFTDIETELLGPGYPARTSLKAPIARVVAETYEELYGQAPAIHPTSLGSGPWYQLCTQFGIDACTAGVGNAQSQAHAPNENILVEDYWMGIKHIAAIIERFGDA